MTVIASAPMPLPRVRLGAATGQTAVTRSSATVIPTARPTYLVPPAFSTDVLYGARNLSGGQLGAGVAYRPGGMRFWRPTSPGWSMSQGRGGRMGAVAPYPVLFAASRYQSRMGRYGARRVRLAGVERFAPSVLYGAYNIQPYGMGRYRSLVQPIRGGMGCCGSRYGGYPIKRLGQNPFSDVWNAGVNVLENLAGGFPINAPTAGGGSVTVAHPFVAQHDFTLPDGTVVRAGQTVTPDEATFYVNASGQDQTTPDPNAGKTPVQQLQQAAFDLPWWGWGLLLIGGGLALKKVLK